jgi:dTDP-D-glucose 4,6-dehydratase
MKTALRETIQWYLAHQDWCRDLQSKRSRDERPGLGRVLAGSRS